MYVLNTVVDPSKWTTGAVIFVTIIALLAMVGLATLLVWFVYKERENYIAEKRAYIKGVLSKSETMSTINSIISKTTFDSPFGLVMLDIDKFGEISNAFNDKIANQLINILAEKIAKVLPLQVQMGRVGADKFVFIFKSEYDNEEIDFAVAKIKDIFNNSFKITFDAEINVTASIAIAYFPIHGRNANQLLQSLSIAIYTAKRDGGDRIVKYSEEMSTKESENLQYYSQVKEGIKNKEFLLFYQPIVDIEKREVIAAEALLRWEHSKLGLINPKDFIHILEQSGDIYWIGIWGLETMINQYTLIHQKFPSIDFKISINLSPKQLLNERIAVDFQKILKKHKMTGRNIVIEIEEFIVFEQQEMIRRNILKLKELGFMFAVDGFALDHNTLSRIEKFPIDIIKINSSFLQEEENLEIRKRLTEILFDYAHRKNITLIAERVENLEMIEYFKQNGVTIDQGYYFSRPISGDHLIGYMSDRSHIQDLIGGNDKPVVQEAEVTEDVKVVEETTAEVDQEVTEEKVENEVTDQVVEDTTPTIETNDEKQPVKEAEAITEPSQAEEIIIEQSIETPVVEETENVENTKEVEDKKDEVEVVEETKDTETNSNTPEEVSTSDETKVEDTEPTAKEAETTKEPKQKSKSTRKSSKKGSKK